MPNIEITDMKETAQIAMLKDICKQLANEPDECLQGGAELLLTALVTAMDELSQEDFFGTEGWEHRFGYED